jgi:WhiB family redox-sensing transcriptional regulator
VDTTNYQPVEQRLPAPVTDSWDWQTAAACRGMDSDTFFHPTRERAEARQTRITAAKQICQGCAVTQECLTHALKAQEPYGIWGGRSESERAAILGVRSLRDPAPMKPPAAR